MQILQHFSTFPNQLQSILWQRGKVEECKFTIGCTYIYIYSIYTEFLFSTLKQRYHPDRSTACSTHSDVIHATHLHLHYSICWSSSLTVSLSIRILVWSLDRQNFQMSARNSCFVFSGFCHSGHPYPRLKAAWATSRVSDAELWWRHVSASLRKPGGGGRCRIYQAEAYMIHRSFLNYSRGTLS